MRRQWATEDNGSEAEDSLTDMDTLSAAQDGQDAENINMDEVLAVGQLLPISCRAKEVRPQAVGKCKYSWLRRTLAVQGCCHSIGQPCRMQFHL